MTMATMKTTRALEPRVQWAVAAPLLTGLIQAGLTRADLSDEAARPAILRFTSDQFMEEFETVLNDRPDQLQQFVARPESFRELPPASLGINALNRTQLKLYQPAHGHFYLVASSLTCRAPGLPDRTVNPATQKIGFVLRRLESDGQRELAWVAQDGGKAWLPVSDALRLATDEEPFPMFPLTYCDAGRKRRIWSGLIPTSSRETFKAAQNLLPDAGAIQADRNKLPANLRDSRLEEFENKVLVPLEQFVGVERPKAAKLASAERDATLFLLLDCAEWLNHYTPTSWAIFLTQVRPVDAGPIQKLYDLFSSQSWLSMLKTVWQQRASIYKEDASGSSLPEFNLSSSTMKVTELREAITNIPLEVQADTSTRTAGPALAKFDSFSNEVPQYIIRCVYQRPNCTPTVHELLSETSAPFAIAGFFDADAPARPVHISLPVDTSIAGLRKFKKNVSFSMSDRLRKQLETVTDLKKAMDGKLGEGKEFDLGLICSFSIPIITICAFMVLMVFLSLFNIVFWWLPFVRMCFPIRLKA
jgi:hypothetical protein